MSQIDGPPPDPAPPGPRRPARPGRRWLVWAGGCLVGALVFSAAAGGWWLANNTLVASHRSAPQPGPTRAVSTASGAQMPDVRGLDKATAEQVLADSAIPVEAISTHDSASVVAPGVVVEQTPAFGDPDVTKVDLGIAVPVSMPTLAGKTKDDAVAILSGYGTSVTIEYRYSTTASEGTVVAGRPAVGAKLGQTATIIVATGGSTLPLGQLNAIEGGCGSEENVVINGRDHPTALMCSADGDTPSTTTWLLSKTVDRFTATVGVPDTGTPGAAAPYLILLDGKVVTRGTASYGTSTTVDVVCTGRIQLAIRVGPQARDRVDVALADAVVYGSRDGVARLAKLR